MAHLSISIYLPLLFLQIYEDPEDPDVSSFVLFILFFDFSKIDFPYLKWINFRVEKISRIEDRKFSRGLNFANQPVFRLISFILLGVLAKFAISKISRGQNFAKMAKIRENREN